MYHSEGDSDRVQACAILRNTVADPTGRTMLDEAGAGTRSSLQAVAQRYEHGALTVLCGGGRGPAVVPPGVSPIAGGPKPWNVARPPGAHSTSFAAVKLLNPFADGFLPATSVGFPLATLPLGCTPLFPLTSVPFGLELALESEMEFALASTLASTSASAAWLRVRGGVRASLSVAPSSLLSVALL